VTDKEREKRWSDTRPRERQRLELQKTDRRFCGEIYLAFEKRNIHFCSYKRSVPITGNEKKILINP
jgi:hypothetical protein